MLPTLNEEQSRVVATVLEGRNVVVNAVAGAGKSTTGFHIARELRKRGKRVLLVVYNAAMKRESREIAKVEGLDNIEIHSYHSLAMAMCGAKGHTDHDIAAALKRGVASLPREFDAIIMDEQQDMRRLYYRLVHQVLKLHMRTPQLVCFGDVHQSIYGFLEADARYLSHAPRIFQSGHQWRECYMSTSSRTPQRIAAFINAQLLGRDLIVASQKGGRVVYVRTNIFDPSATLRLVKDALNLRGITYEDLLILTPSLRSKAVQNLENAMVAAGIPCMVPAHDDESITEAVARKKVTFSTFHQAKGLGRKVVIVFGFDSSYHEYFATDTPLTSCPNAMYVAVTRASEVLMLLQHHTTTMFPTLHEATLKQHAHVVGLETQRSQSVLADPQAIQVIPRPERRMSVTNALKFVKQDVLQTAFNQLTWRQVAEREHEGTLPHTVSTTDDMAESVSDLNGLAIPAMYEWEQSGEAAILTEGLRSVPWALRDRLVQARVTLQSEHSSFAQKMEAMLFVAAISQAKRSGYNCKAQQLTNYAWLEDSQPVVEACFSRMHTLFSDTTRYEHSMTGKIGRTTLEGYADALDTAWNKLTESKVIQGKLQPEHLLQLAAYRFLHGCEDWTYQLANLLTGEIIELTSTREECKLALAIGTLARAGALSD
ncbi:hypothetical protein WJX72_000518 [[Myrmecia] bisecta]|uniref:DNA helicase n=1 Tax=[Myrmecia] bisecta TaxID=41462 RepID=A0AAW1QAW0_9CHLO